MTFCSLVCGAFAAEVGASLSAPVGSTAVSGLK
jgi:hypothetical protein